MARHRVPEHLRSTNGPEFIATCMESWLKAQRITLYIWPMLIAQCEPIYDELPVVKKKTSSLDHLMASSTFGRCLLPAGARQWVRNAQTRSGRAQKRKRRCQPHGNAAKLYRLVKSRFRRNQTGR